MRYKTCPLSRAFRPAVKSFTATTWVKFKIPSNVRGNPQPGGIITDEITHILNINYHYKKVSGSWAPAYSYIFLSNREVHYCDGVPFITQFAHKYPTTNIFNYTTLYTIPKTLH